MIQAQRKRIYILIICYLFLAQKVIGQRAIFSLGKRIQKRFSGNKQHVSDSPEGEKSNDSSITRRHLAAATTFVLVVLGYCCQKRVAGGGEFVVSSPHPFPSFLTSSVSKRDLKQCTYNTQPFLMLLIKSSCSC